LQKTISELVGVEAPELKPLKKPDELKYPAEMLHWWCSWRRAGRPVFTEETLFPEPDAPAPVPVGNPLPEEGTDPATAKAAEQAQQAYPFKHPQQRPYPGFNRFNRPPVVPKKILPKRIYK
jgi:hypothetical protein